MSGDDGMGDEAPYDYNPYIVNAPPIPDPPPVDAPIDFYSPPPDPVEQQQPWFDPTPAPAPPPFMPGGSPTVPPTAINVEPQAIAPSVFTPAAISTQPVPPAPAPAPSGGGAPAPTPAASGGDIFNLADESGFNGVTYAGFSPGSHQGANLMDPMNAKYALQQFLVNSGSNLGTSAPQIAAALNAKYGAAYGNPNFFIALDGETIIMPDGQYVHAAPNGYAMSAGAFNPQNTREVFWGATGLPYSGTGNAWAGTPNAGPAGGNPAVATPPAAGGTSGIAKWVDSAAGPAAAGTGTGTGTGTSSGGHALTPADLAALMSQLQGMFPAPTTQPGPDISGPGAALTDGLNQVGNTPYDHLVDQSLSDLLANHGQTPFGSQIEATLADIISRGGIAPSTRNRLIAARDDEAGAFAGQMADARNALASRGLASVPGSPQGPEVSAISRISENLAPTYATAVSNIESNAMDMGQKSLMDSLQMATGMSAQDSNTILNAIGTGTSRQTALANIALRTLEDNIDWNKFLANYGLDKAKVAETLAQGRISALVPLLSLFLQLAGSSAQGYIGN